MPSFTVNGCDMTSLIYTGKKIGLDNHNGPGIRELSNVPRSDLILTAFCPNLI